MNNTKITNTKYLGYFYEKDFVPDFKEIRFNNVTSNFQIDKQANYAEASVGTLLIPEDSMENFSTSYALLLKKYRNNFDGDFLKAITDFNGDFSNLSLAEISFYTDLIDLINTNGGKYQYFPINMLSPLYNQRFAYLLKYGNNSLQIKRDTTGIPYRVYEQYSRLAHYLSHKVDGSHKASSQGIKNQLFDKRVSNFVFFTNLEMDIIANASDDMLQNYKGLLYEAVANGSKADEDPEEESIKNNLTYKDILYFSTSYAEKELTKTHQLGDRNKTTTFDWEKPSSNQVEVNQFLTNLFRKLFRSYFSHMAVTSENDVPLDFPKILLDDFIGKNFFNKLSLENRLAFASRMTDILNPILVYPDLFLNIQWDFAPIFGIDALLSAFGEVELRNIFKKGSDSEYNFAKELDSITELQQYKIIRARRNLVETPYTIMSVTKIRRQLNDKNKIYPFVI